MQDVVIALIVDDLGLWIASRPKAPFKSMIEVPGGKREIHESLTAALSRELREELGLKSFDSSFYFKSTSPQGVELYWFIVKALEPFKSSFYKDLRQVQLKDLHELKWIAHNFLVLDKIKRVPKLKPAPICYIYPSDDVQQTHRKLQAVLLDDTTYKKQASLCFKACLQHYVDVYPLWVVLWSNYLVEM